MNAMITVIGKDTVGIIARVTTTLAELHINILDLSQTIMQGNFTMVMLVDLAASPKPFGEIRERLEALGADMGLTIRIQNTEIFEAMHSI